MKKNKSTLMSFYDGYINKNESKENLSKAEEGDKLSVFKHGTLQIRLSEQQTISRLLPHLQDCAYFVIEGSGEIFNGEERQKLTRGDFMFVPTGKKNKLFGLTADFVVWEVSFEPDGGELTEK